MLFNMAVEKEASTQLRLQSINFSGKFFISFSDQINLIHDFLCETYKRH